MNNWKKCKLGDIAEITMGQSPKSEFYNFDNIGMPFLQGNRTFGRKYPYFDTYCTKYKKIAKKGEILFSVRAPVGDINFANNDICIGRGLCSMNAKNGENEFLYYLLHNLRSVIINNESGSVFGSVNKNDLQTIEITLPPLEEQRQIAAILSSIDDKIELLHEQNKTLEELAQTLFRHYFIENPNPSWQEKPLSEIAKFLNGLACQKYPPKNFLDKLPVLKIKELSDGAIGKNPDYASSEIADDYIVNSGDVIFSWSATLMVKIWGGEKSVLNQHLFKVSSDKYPKWFFYYWTKYHLREFITISQAHATTMGHIKRKDLDNAMCKIPKDEYLKKCDLEISPKIQKIENNLNQIRTLENMRDILLPKLLNGEIKINN
ncbi:restriction endonuclease subunit S [Campylobacter coli]|uniref:restriction endonuclease subunit S n=1 Tax=Campylobacter coli TaxID=195 RepID=UPI0009300C36|nr:restriction endonuclease subunit S [Campylobacter coli]